MREIKFRAWDKVANQMSPEFILFGEFTLLGAVHDWQWEISPQKKQGVENVLRYDSLGRLNDLEIMQYTGLKDKNGKEIYEGDIIKKGDPSYWNDVDKTPDEVDLKLWRGGTAQVVACPFGYFMQEIDCGEWAYNDPEGQHWSDNEIEVVGNIYENAELLKEPEPK